jgi:hypothetical protein
MKKIIHRIFFNFDEGIDPFSAYLENWRTQLPDFEIRCWDKTNLPLDLNAYTRVLAAEKNHAFLSDFFRCWLLENQGGVYLDADIEILDGPRFRAIYEECQNAPDYTLFIGVESRGNGHLTPHSMGVKSGSSNEILRFMMNLYETDLSGPLHYAIKKFNMPYLMTLYFMDKERRGENPGSSLGAFYNIDIPKVTGGIKIYPTEFFSPVTTRGKTKIISSYSTDTCLCHHFAATWITVEQGLKRAKLLGEALLDADYVVDPALLPLVRTRTAIKGLKAVKPRWSFSEGQIRALENIGNALVPFGSVLYRLLKKSKK